MAYALVHMRVSQRTDPEVLDLQSALSAVIDEYDMDLDAEGDWDLVRLAGFR